MPGQTAHHAPAIDGGTQRLRQPDLTRRAGPFAGYLDFEMCIPLDRSTVSTDSRRTSMSPSTL